MPEKEEMRDLISKYTKKIESQLGPTANQGMDGSEGRTMTHEYLKFKDEYLSGHLTLYEKACNLSEKIIKVTPEKKKEAELIESISICHLNITPTGATSFAMIFPIVIILVTSIISILFFK